jgi:hypothetical protein
MSGTSDSFGEEAMTTLSPWEDRLDASASGDSDQVVLQTIETADRRIVDPARPSLGAKPNQDPQTRLGRGNQPRVAVRYSDLVPAVEMAGSRRLSRALERVRRVAADALRQRMNTEIADLAGRIRRLHDAAPR